jgi:Rrf2 family cysteine metabolism transcriptional repressor
MKVGISSAPALFSMRVSSRAHYSLRMMTEFAKTYGSGPVSLAEVARVEHLPLAYLEQLAGQLRRAGLLESTRGVHGGYSLTRSPETISVLDILSVVEGSVAPVECLGPEYAAGSCVRDGDCASRSLWGRLKTSIEDVMRATSLAEMIGDHSLLHDLGPLPDLMPLPMAGDQPTTHEASNVHA